MWMARVESEPRRGRVRARFVRVISLVCVPVWLAVGCSSTEADDANAASAESVVIPDTATSLERVTDFYCNELGGDVSADEFMDALWELSENDLERATDLMGDLSTPELKDLARSLQDGGC